MAEHRYVFVDRNQTTIKCELHPNEREVLRPTNRNEILTRLVEAGDWGGQALDVTTLKLKPKPETAAPQTTTTESASFDLPEQPGAQLPAVTKPKAGGLEVMSRHAVEYESFDGRAVSLSVEMFQLQLCPDATVAQAQYALGWSAHNRIDPFANEAYFSVIQGQLVIQVSKDAWFRRVERDQRLEWMRDGIIVETSLEILRDAVLAGSDDYQISQILKEVLIKNFLEGKSLEAKGISSRLTVKKRGQFVADKENLVGAWAEIKRKDRPEPYVFQINKDGWEGKTKGGEDNVFWRTKEAFMIWKTARKNNCRQTFPELSGLMSHPEFDFDAAEAADYELRELERKSKIKQLHGAGMKSPLLLDHDKLHTLAGALYDRRGISELQPQELATLTELVSTQDPQKLQDIQEIVNDRSSTATEAEPEGPLVDADFPDNDEPGGDAGSPELGFSEPAN